MSIRGEVRNKMIKVSRIPMKGGPAAAGGSFYIVIIMGNLQLSVFFVVKKLNL
jgi:hypothetical protein